MKVYINSDDCVHCESCKNDCPVQAIENFSINQNKCIQCGDCFEICPVGAIIKISSEIQLTAVNY